MTFSRLLFGFIVSLAATACAFAADDPSRAEKETEQLTILRADSSAPGEKALACKRLAVYGSKEAVPDLAKLLTNPELSSWARIALEAIPGPEADAALIQTLDSLEGRLLVGAINSLGVRHPEAAVEPLTARLKNNSPDVAAAAAVALGHVGNAAAVNALQDVLKSAPDDVRSAAAEGCVLAAETAFTAGRAADAVALYDTVRKADVPKQRVLEATRGAILARQEQGIDVLVEQLRSTDRDFYRIALSTAREFPGSKVDQVLANELKTAKPPIAALIITAMADRPQTVILPAILAAAEKGDKLVRLAAIEALGRVGNVSCLASLLEVALENDDDLVKSSKTALADLPDAAVDGDIVKRLEKPQKKAHALLIELVGSRRIAAMPALLAALGQTDAAVRSAALVSLGQTVPPDKLSVLITAVVSPKHAEDGPIAQKALKEASIRMPDREACAKELAAALSKAATPVKIVLLEILGAVGGTNSLQALAAAAKNQNAELQDTSTKILGEWMTIDAAPVLLELSSTIPGEKYQTRALRGYFRIARQFIMEDPERIEMCRKALSAARHPNERKLVIDVLKRPQNQSLPLLKYAVELANKDAELKDDAIQAALANAASSKIADKQSEIAELLGQLELPEVKLEIVKAEYGAGGMQKDVTAALQKAAADRQWIKLPVTNYSEAFEGDPAPGTPKKLTIQYRINDKAGETSLVENSLVILQLPK